MNNVHVYKKENDTCSCLQIGSIILIVPDLFHLPSQTSCLFRDCCMTIMSKYRYVVPETQLDNIGHSDISSHISCCFPRLKSSHVVEGWGFYFHSVNRAHMRHNSWNKEMSKDNWVLFYAMFISYIIVAVYKESQCPCHNLLPPSEDKYNWYLYNCNQFPSFSIFSCR